MADEVELRWLSSAEARDRIDELADLYERAYADRLDGKFFSRASFTSWFGSHISHYPIVLVGAYDNERLIGWAYSFRLPTDAGWWTRFQGELPPEVLTATRAGRVHVLAEIMVLPDLRRRGIAKHLYTELLATWIDADFATLAVLPDNEPALTAYSSWGWVRVGHIQAPHGGPRFEAHIRKLYPARLGRA